jgi:beta-glucosidase
MIDRREFLRRSGQATLGAAVMTVLPSWATDGCLQPHLPGVRFHVEWPRVQPTGSGPGDVRGLGFYSRLVDRLLEQGARPMPTLFRGGLPPALDATGGWTERATAERFAEYAGIVAGALGDRVRDWVLLEEPSVFLRTAYPDLERYLRATHVANLAVGCGYRAVRATSAAVQVGSVVRFDLFEGATGSAEDAAAAERCRRFEADWFLQPVLKGAYPNAFLAHIPYDLMNIENADFGVTQAPLDVVGLRVHERRVVAYAPVDSSGTGLCYALRGAGRPTSARDTCDAVGRLTEDYGVQAYVAQPLPHDDRGSTM